MTILRYPSAFNPVFSGAPSAPAPAYGYEPILPIQLRRKGLARAEIFQAIGPQAAPRLAAILSIAARGRRKPAQLFDFGVILPQTPAATPAIWGYETVHAALLRRRAGPQTSLFDALAPPSAPRPPVVFIGGGPAHRIEDEPDHYPLSLPPEADEALDEAVALMARHIGRLQDELILLRALVPAQRAYAQAMMGAYALTQGQAMAAFRAALLTRINEENDDELLLLAAELMF